MTGNQWTLSAIEFPAHPKKDACYRCKPSSRNKSSNAGKQSSCIPWLSHRISMYLCFWVTKGNRNSLPISIAESIGLEFTSLWHSDLPILYNNITLENCAVEVVDPFFLLSIYVSPNYTFSSRINGKFVFTNCNIVVHNRNCINDSFWKVVFIGEDYSCTWVGLCITITICATLM